MTKVEVSRRCFVYLVGVWTRPRLVFGRGVQIVLAYVEAFNRGDIDAVFTLFTTNAWYTAYSVGWPR
jgi:hypothetical protein